MKDEEYLNSNITLIEEMKILVKDAENTLKNRLLNLVSLQEKIAISLKEQHPLSLLLNADFHCHHFDMDFYNTEYHSFHMIEDILRQFNHFTVHEISSGEKLNEKFSDVVFEEQKNYVVYVRYEYPEDEKYESHVSQMKLIPFENREILEFLIFEKN